MCKLHEMSVIKDKLKLEVKKKKWKMQKIDIIEKRNVKKKTGGKVKWKARKRINHVTYKSGVFLTIFMEKCSQKYG